MSFLNYCALFMMPGWSDVMNLPVPERIAKLRDPDVRKWMDERARSPEAGVFSRLASWGRYMIGDTFSAANDGLKGQIVADLAEEQGKTAFDTLVDIVIADDLRTVLWPLPSDSDPESWKMRAEAWDHPLVMIGGSDAGAHLDRMCGAPVPHEVPRRLPARPEARLDGTLRAAHDAGPGASCSACATVGTLREGNHADVFVFDPETVEHRRGQARRRPARRHLTPVRRRHRGEPRDGERHDDRASTASPPTLAPAPCCARAATPTPSRSPPTRSFPTRGDDPRFGRQRRRNDRVRHVRRRSAGVLPARHQREPAIVDARHGPAGRRHALHTDRLPRSRRFAAMRALRPLRRCSPI